IAAERIEPQARPLAAPASRISVEHAATAAVAAALASPNDVPLRPITPKPSLFVEPVMADPAPQDIPKAFIPPQPERASRPRMPRIDELPMPAQNEIRAQQRGEAEEAGPEQQRMTLLRRLAAVGLGRREEPEAEQQSERPQLPPLPPRQPVRMPDPVSEYAKRSPAPTPQGLDIQGRRSLPVHKPVDDDQLEIPAFLRRQAN